MKAKRAIGTTAVAAILLAGLAAAGAAGAEPKRPVVAPPVIRVGPGRCTASLPAGWVWLKDPDGPFEIVHDGGDFGRITIRWTRVWNVGGGRRPIPPGPDALYLGAERVLSDAAATEGTQLPRVRRLAAGANLRVSMFEADIDFTRLGIAYRRRIDGWVDEGWQFTAMFEAPVIGYFDRDLPSYDALLASVCSNLPQP